MSQINTANIPFTHRISPELKTEENNVGKNLGHTTSNGFPLFGVHEISETSSEAYIRLVLVKHKQTQFSLTTDSFSRASIATHNSHYTIKFNFFSFRYLCRCLSFAKLRFSLFTFHWTTYQFSVSKRVRVSSCMFMCACVCVCVTVRVFRILFPFNCVM